jgi:uncharacterized phage protein (TIGR02220 family)
MKHILDVEIAKKYGVNAAILLENLGYWIKQNEANQTNFFDGYYWTFNSRRAYREIFPYMSERQIDTAFRKLIDDGLVITGNYNRLAYDRTLWYALTQKGKSILHFDGMESDVLQFGAAQNVKPIPNINTDINKDINTEKNIIGKVTDVEEKESGLKVTANIVNQTAIVALIVNYLNEKAGTHYRASTKATARHIEARLKEGFTIQDCFSVIDKKVAEWKGSDMEKYLRPETLFGSKFEGYLNARENVNRRGENGIKLDGRTTDDLDGIL